MDAFAPVFRWLDRAGRATWGAWLLGGAAAALLLIAAGLAASAAVALFGADGAARAVLSVFAAGAAAAAVSAVVVAYRRTATPARTASAVEDPALRAALRAAVELRGEMAARGPDYPYSGGLTHAHAAAAASAVEGRSPAREVGLARAPVAIAALACGAAILSAVALGPPSMRAALKRVVVPAKAAAATNASSVPGLFFDVTYRFPAYAGLKERTERRRDGALKALKGTEAQVRATYVGGVRRAEAVRGGTRIPLPVQQNTALVSFVLDEPFTWRLEFDGPRERVVTPVYAAEPLADRPPSAAIEAPPDLLAGDREVSEDESIDLALSAEDDYGLKSIALVVAVQGTGRERRLSVSEPSGAPRQWGGEYRLDLAPLGLSPGDRVVLNVEAHDNDTVSGSKPGRSRDYYLKVYSAAEHLAAFLENAARAWEQVIAWLAFDLDHPGAADARSQRLAVAKTALGLLRDAAIGAAQAPMVSPDLRRGLGTAARDLGVAHAELKAALAGGGPLIERRLAAELGALERHVLALQDLLDRERLSQVNALAADIEARKKRLADLIDRYRATKDERLRREIDAAMAALEGKLREITKLLAQLQHAVGDVNLNRTAIADADLSKLADLMRDMRRDFAGDDAARLAARLEELGAKMDALTRGVQQFGAALGDARYAEIAAKVGALARDLSGIAAGEKDLLGRTMARRDALRAREERHVAARAAAVRRKILDAIAALKKDMGAPPADLPADETAQVAAAQALLDSLKRLVDEGEFWDAAEEARGLSLKTRKIAETIGLRRRALSFDPMGGERAARAAAAEGRAVTWRRRAGEIVETVEGLFPKPGALLGPGEVGEMGGLAGEQAGLGRRLQKVRDGVDGLGQGMPALPPEIGQGLAEAHEGMGTAERHLKGLNPYGARTAEEGVIERLQRTRDALEKMASPQGAPFPYAGGRDRGDEGWGGADIARDRVEIPRPSDYTVPREFRQDIIDAMKDRVVKGFEDATKKYYEELVK